MFVDERSTWEGAAPLAGGDDLRPRLVLPVTVCHPSLAGLAAGADCASASSPSPSPRFRPLSGLTGPAVKTSSEGVGGLVADGSAGGGDVNERPVAISEPPQTDVVVVVVVIVVVAVVIAVPATRHLSASAGVPGGDWLDVATAAALAGDASLAEATRWLIPLSVSRVVL